MRLLARGGGGEGAGGAGPDGRKEGAGGDVNSDEKEEEEEEEKADHLNGRETGDGRKGAPSCGTITSLHRRTRRKSGASLRVRERAEIFYRESSCTNSHPTMEGGAKGANEPPVEEDALLRVHCLRGKNSR